MAIMTNPLSYMRIKLRNMCRAADMTEQISLIIFNAEGRGS